MRKKIVSFFLAMMMGCSIFSIQADAATQVYVQRAANVRSEASNSSKVLGVVSKGTKLSKLSEARGWTKVSYQGKEAYIATSFLTEIASGTTASPTVTTAKTATTTQKADGITNDDGTNTTKVYVNHYRVNIRKSASSKSKLLGTAKKGDSFDRVGSVNGWTKIVYGTGYAYISSQYLTTKSGSVTTATTASTTATTATPGKTVVYVNNSYINVRAQASSKSKLLGKVYKGEKLYKLGTVGSFTKIEYNNSVGYVATAYLTTGKSDTGTTYTAYVNNSYVNVRKAASSKSALLGKLYKGVAVTVVGKSGNFSKIKYNNSYGYVATSYLSTKKSDTGTTYTAYVSNKYVNVRKAASSKSALLGKLYKGAKVTVVGKSGSFSKIKYNNSYAYVATAYLRA